MIFDGTISVSFWNVNTQGLCLGTNHIWHTTAHSYLYPSSNFLPEGRFSRPKASLLRPKVYMPEQQHGSERQYQVGELTCSCQLGSQTVFGDKVSDGSYVLGKSEHLASMYRCKWITEPSQAFRPDLYPRSILEIWLGPKLAYFEHSSFICRFYLFILKLYASGVYLRGQKRSNLKN